jgi:hypothetical protein
MVKNTIDSMGKQLADPIEANFLKGIMVPSGILALVDLQSSMNLRKVGQGPLKMLLTRSRSTMSDASLRSMVAKLPSILPSRARSLLTDWSVKRMDLKPNLFDSKYTIRGLAILCCISII